MFKGVSVVKRQKQRAQDIMRVSQRMINFTERKGMSRQVNGLVVEKSGTKSVHKRTRRR